jgi:hypothetical protein
VRQGLRPKQTSTSNGRNRCLTRIFHREF